MAITLSNLLKNLEDWGSVPDPFQFTKPPQLLDNQLCQNSSVSFFSKGEQGTIKIGKCQPLKIVRSCYIVILIKS